MGKRSEQNPITWLILVALVGILFEISFNTESLVFLGVSALLIYFGKKKSTKSSGAIYIIVGISIFVITIISTVFFKIVLFCVLIYLLFRYRKKKSIQK
nr:hypothetical protein [Heyndrickxia oleronia]